MLDASRILEICKPLITPGSFAVDPHIPPRKLVNAREKLKIPRGDTVLGLADFTVFGSNKDGLAITDRGIYWNSGFGGGEGSLKWDDFGGAHLTRDGNKINIGGTRYLYCTGPDAESLLQALIRLRDAASSAVAEPGTYGAPLDEPVSAAAKERLTELLWAVDKRLGVGRVGRFFMAPIPRAPLARALTLLPIPPGEEVLALLDLTHERTTSPAVAVAASGIYWNSGFSAFPGYLPWSKLAEIPPPNEEGSRIEMGNGRYLNTVGAAFSHQEIASVISLLRDWAVHERTEAHSAPSMADEIPSAELVASPPPPPAPSSRRWMLARDGRQSGPFNGATLSAMVSSGQTDPDVHYAWTEGMAEWLPFRDVPELAALLAPPPPPMMPPSPPQAPGGTVDVNRAGVEELLGLPGVTLDGAGRLVAERARRGGFSTAEELGEILGLQPHQVEELRGEVVFGRLAAPSRRVIDY